MKELTGLVIWFTGLSGSGKSTIALKLKEKLEAQGEKVSVLDGDAVRAEKHARLGFSREDIRENNRLIAELARDEAQKFDFVLVPVISPYKEDRQRTRLIIGLNFIEVFVNSPLETCIKRDVKGLYKKALAGEISNFIGISENNPYEAPEHSDIEIAADKESADDGVNRLLKFFEGRKIL
ncbi:MAG: adenylyl-sulfate kinase [bacterium]|nr:adenylyl-sulfate kinase [bacterium]